MKPEDRADFVAMMHGERYQACGGLDDLRAEIAMEIKEAVAAEREACAKIVEGCAPASNPIGRVDLLAAAIRSRV